MSALVILCLVGAVLLGIIHNLAPIRVKTQAFGVAWNTGARDTEPGPVPPLAGRLERARVNFHENFPLFAVLALLLLITGGTGALGAYAALAWLVARIVYLPLYARGVPRWRTLVWAASMVALVVMGVDLFLP